LLSKLLIRLYNLIPRRLIPAGFRLPFRCWLLQQTDQVEKEYLYLDEILPAKRRVSLDVGANHGVYAYKLSKTFEKVYAFEPNLSVTADLKDYLRNIEVVESGVSISSCAATLFVPEVGGRLLTGWGSLSKDNCGEAESLFEVQAQFVSLDSLHLSRIDFIKVDVEGHELEVLRGAARTLKDNHPVLLVEIKPENMSPVVQYLLELGYRLTRLVDVAGVDGESENFLFYPLE
jgi:FkbM family methyltransferase